MENFQFYLPVKIIFGWGSLEELPSQALTLGKRALLVTGRRAMKESGILERAIKLLKKGGIEVSLFNRVEPEPSTSTVNAGVREARRGKVEMVIGLGGGSALDVAKAIAGVVNEDMPVEDFLEGKEVKKAELPFLAIPTTSGTGAEVTPNAVLINRERGIKKSLRHPSLFARIAIVDPQLTLTLPPRATAYSGMDALCQAIESLVSLGSSPLTDTLALLSIRCIGRSIVRAYRDGSDRKAREDMALGSLLSGITLSNARLGLVHGVIHPLGVHYHLPHGLLAGMLLPSAMEFNMPVVAHKYRWVAEEMGEKVEGLKDEEGGKLAVRRIKEITSRLDFPDRLSLLGVKRDDFPEIARDTLPSGSFQSNPRKAGEREIIEILEKAF